MAKTKRRRHPIPVHGKKESITELRKKARGLSEYGFRINGATVLMALHAHWGFGTKKIQNLVRAVRAESLKIKDRADAVEQVRKRTGWKEYNGLKVVSTAKFTDEEMLKAREFQITEIEKGYAALNIVLKEKYRFSLANIKKANDAGQVVREMLNEDDPGITVYCERIRATFKDMFKCDLDELFEEELDDDAVFDAVLEID